MKLLKAVLGALFILGLYTLSVHRIADGMPNALADGGSGCVPDECGTPAAEASETITTAKRPPLDQPPDEDSVFF